VIRISRQVTIHRPIEAVFRFLCSPENPELDSLQVTESLTPGFATEVIPEPDDPESVRWTLAVTEFAAPTRLAWRTEYKSSDLVIPGSCTYELTARDGATVVRQTYERPMPAGLYRPTLPLLWWKVRGGMHRRLREAKDILEA
jgi:hypothetical protein